MLIWIEPISRHKFYVASGERFVSAEGRRFVVRDYMAKNIGCLRIEGLKQCTQLKCTHRWVASKSLVLANVTLN